MYICLRLVPKSIIVVDASKDPIARKLRLRRGRRDQEEADQDQAKILKVQKIISPSTSY